MHTFVSELFDSGEDCKMKKPKSDERTRDRLSQLPDSLILVILSLLPMRDVVQTTILSKRWKDLWTAVSCLDFNNDAHRGFFDKFRNFVNRAMIHWKGTKILKFGLKFNFHWYYTSDLDIWLRFALEKGVEELYIHLLDPVYNTTYMDVTYSAPRRLYSCSSLRKLTLLGCDLRFDSNVRWNQLKSLSIDGVHRPTEHAMNEVLSGAPQLEVLILGFVESHDHNLNIQSSSLKKLKIEQHLGRNGQNAVDVDALVSTKLRIWAPNLETLEISGAVYSECVLMDISSLTSATVRLYVPENCQHDRLSGCKLLEGMLGPVLQSIRRVGKVALTDSCIKVLGDMRKKGGMLAPLSYAKSVELYSKEINEVVRFLEIFPELTKLVLHSSYPDTHKQVYCFQMHCDSRAPFFDAESSMKSRTDLPKYSLLHLTTVEITWTDCDDSIFMFVRFLLKYAGKLERLVFGITGLASLRLESLLLAAEKLLRVPRSSPTAAVILCKK